ncbi:hypothetical protein AAVH_16398 [Aphelenchoides avenae]|nr:hypothetical protein AAVH_16398 [Aphelenchus avenae]
MQADVPDDPLVRETMALLGPGAKDSTLDDVAWWIRRLEELCGSQDAALAPTSFRTDVGGSCLSKFPASGDSSESTKLQTKAVKGYPPLPELHLEKVSSKKKNARGDAKLRLSVDRGALLVLLTITDLHGASRTLRVVTADENDLIPIRHPATTIEATVIPLAPEQLLERLRLVKEKVKRQHEHHAPTSASPQQGVEEASAQRQGGGWKDVPVELLNAMFKIAIQKDPKRAESLAYLAQAATDEHKVLLEKWNEPTSNKAKKNRLFKQLACKEAEVDEVVNEIAEIARGGWKYVPPEEFHALFEMAKRKDPKRAEVLARRGRAAIDEYNMLAGKYNSTSNESKKKKSLSMLMRRKEYEFDEVMTEIAGIAVGGWLCPMKVEFDPLEIVRQNDPALAYRALDLLTMHDKLKAKLESTSDPPKKKRLATLVERKELQIDEAMSRIAVILSRSKQGGSKAPNDVSARLKEAFVLVGSS